MYHNLWDKGYIGLIYSELYWGNILGVGQLRVKVGEVLWECDGF